MVRQYFLDYCEGLKGALDAVPLERFEEFLGLLETAFHEERQVFLMGNGGSGCATGHMPAWRSRC